MRRRSRGPWWGHRSSRWSLRLAPRGHGRERRAADGRGVHVPRGVAADARFAAPQSWVSMVVKTTFTSQCGPGPNDTRTVESSTTIHLCFEEKQPADKQLTWVSSGDECKVCDIIAEMAPSPIVPDKREDELPLARAPPAAACPITHVGRAVALLAENDGGTDVDYAWRVSGGEPPSTVARCRRVDTAAGERRASSPGDRERRARGRRGRTLSRRGRRSPASGFAHELAVVGGSRSGSLRQSGSLRESWQSAVRVSTAAGGARGADRAGEPRVAIPRRLGATGGARRDCDCLQRLCRA